MLRFRRSIRTKNRFYESLNEKQIEKKIVYYTIKYRIYDWLCCFVIKHCLNLKSEFEFAKLSKKVSKQNFKTNYFDAIKNLHTWFQSFDFVDIFNDKRSLFQVFDYHNNNHKSKTSKQSKKFAQFVEILMRNEYVTFKQSKNNAKTTISIVLFSLQNIKKYFRQKTTWRFQSKTRYR